MTYNPNIPLPGDFLSDSQPQLRNNFSVANTAFGIDHTPFTGVTNQGFHKPVHLISQGSSNPTAVAGTNIVYAKSYTPDTSPASSADIQLFSRTAGGGISQLTGNSAALEGYQWLGGVLIQWGVVTFSGSSASHKTDTVTFQSRSAGNTIPFPNNIFVVNATLRVASSSETTASNTIAIRSASKTTFVWVFNSSSGSGSTLFPGFYWTAIGN